MKKHVFDIEVARIVGVNAAILLENIAYWCEHNQANEENYHDGHYWTFNSMKAFEELFPYLKQNAIRTALGKLKDAGLIIVGNYNKSAYDRTSWYALTDKANAILGIHTSICEKPQMELGESTNQFEGNNEPIPDITSVVTSSVTSDVSKPKRKRFVPPSLDDVKAYCNERHNSVDAQKFLDYYSMTGWKTKGGAVIKDWKACVRTWELNTRNEAPKYQTQAQTWGKTQEQLEAEAEADKVLFGI